MLTTEEGADFILNQFPIPKRKTLLVAQLLISIGHMNIIKSANDTITSLAKLLTY